MIREGLTSPWIPDGWDWGGAVSDQCPVWAELNLAQRQVSHESVESEEIMKSLQSVFTARDESDDSFHDCE